MGLYGVLAATLISATSENAKAQENNTLNFGTLPYMAPVVSFGDFWERTDPDEVKNPQRNLSGDRIYEEVKDKRFYER